MNKITNNNICLQRVLYTLCFFAICIIDWVKGSLNGRIQMVATNMTGIVLAIMILSRFKYKDFLRRIYVMWLLLCIIAIPVGIHIVSNTIPYKGQIISAAANIVVYGFIVIRIISGIIQTRSYRCMRLRVFVIWLGMLFFMLYSINEDIWPAWFAVVFGALYFADFDNESRENLYSSIVDGIIIGFFVIQGMALLFRPYDIVRYVGLYINPNMNALFYLMSYSSFLCKWYWLKKNDRHFIYRAITVLLSGSMFSFCIFTGCKTVLLCMLVITLPFSVLSLRYFGNKVLSFVRIWFTLGIICVVSIPIVYVSIRYIPTIHLHPLYFEGEYSLRRVQPGEPRDSEKYISFENAMEENAGRLFYKLPQILHYYDSLVTIKVYAAELEGTEEIEYLFTEEEFEAGINPIRYRYEIQKSFFKRLNWIGHKNDYEGAHININYTAPHAHNVFIQFAFLYGIPAGVLFILIVFSFALGCIRLLRRGEDYNACIILCFVISFVVFGFFEIDWMCGQMPFTLFFLLFRDIVRK